MKIKLFTHTDLDGVGCAILAYLAYGKENVDVEYCNYDDVDLRVSQFFIKGNSGKYDKVFITDISINDDLAVTIDQYAKPGLWQLFDHHQTALELNKYDWCNVLIEAADGSGLKTCGTELFGVYLLMQGMLDRYGNTVVNGILQFIGVVRDYDTWRWVTMDDDGMNSKYVNDLLDIYGRGRFIEIMSARIYAGFLSITPEERLLLTERANEIDRYVEQKNNQLICTKDIYGRLYGYVFAERFFSELGNRLCQMTPELDYVVIIDISNGKISYRTIRDDLNLGTEIAHAYGGGGHAKAAGSTFDREYISGLIIKKLFENDEMKG